MNEIKSPKSDVGKKQVLLTETANVKIKEMIVESLKINKSKDILAKEINAYINAQKLQNHNKQRRKNKQPQYRRNVNLLIAQ